MKTLKETILESVQIDESKDELFKLIDKTIKKDQDQLLVSEDFNTEISEKYHLSELWMKQEDDQKIMFNTDLRVVELISIQVYPLKRRNGYGKAVLEEIAEWADARNVVISGDPDDMFDSTIDGLMKLYGSVGFERSELFDTVPNRHNFVHAIVRWPNGEREKHLKDITK